MISELANLAGGEHYLALLLVLIFSCILLSKSIISEHVNQERFWITLLACALLIVQDLTENYAQTDPARRDLRMISSIAGYILRPMAILGFLLVVWPSGRPSWFLWIPFILNGLLFGSAIFAPLSFSFDADYCFQRGPLGNAVFYVCFGYLVMILYTIHIRFKDRRAGDTFIIYLCALGCIGAMTVDVLFEEITLISAILISSMVFYLFLRTQDMDHDSLTRLWNRWTFYEDCRKNGNAVTAVASIDMNGLKKINDEQGHDAGDRALKTIGRGLRAVMDRKRIAYRMGGDEFMLLFFHCSEEEISKTVKAFLDEMRKAEMSIAMGLAKKQECADSLDEMIRVSDRRMYEQKSEYYRTHDRRRLR
ncbi:MAG: GGDEF domain-containing protein [Clostridia bacterium]|nr:GGDEF domain-containing protein [Clostridia bacterium]